MTSRAEYLKLWREKNREKVKAYKAKHYQENKATICEKRKKYYADNSKIILEKQAKTGDPQGYQQGYRDCACGKTLKIVSYYLHRKNWCPLTKAKK